jgi:hypothetical protein
MVLFLLFSGFGTTSPAYAQMNSEQPSYERTQQSPGGSGSTNLPSWAEPKTGEQQPKSERGGMRTRSPNDPPGDGAREPIPLGGLEWLILAGAGYGLFKLRDDE